MLSLNTAPAVPWVWGAFMQCCHRTCQAQKKYFSNSDKQKLDITKDHRSKLASAFQDTQIQQSFIDRLIPAVASLGPNYQLQVEALTPRTFTSSFLQASQTGLFGKSQVRTFRIKADSHGSDGLGNLSPSQNKDLESVVKKAGKILNLNANESKVFSHGLKLSSEGSSQSKSTRFMSWGRFSAILFIGYIGYKIFVAALSDNQSQENNVFGNASKDYRAEIPDVSFDDVKGIDEVKHELEDVVEFLRDPERFTNLGGKLPKGVLLVGPPGTGKTLLARAIAGEANVPFYFASGSEFDEVFVGVGSSRIRKLFATARENAPCIVFIDEIDACGSTRTSSPLQPYARQTINQLLQEMDGFTEKESVVVLAATNMGSVLDKALTRPGRFDTEITVMSPDIKGRKEILQLYASRIVLGDDIDLEKIARLTGGMTGASLSNLVNQAALRAAQLKKSFVEQTDLEYALDKLHLGPELKSRIRTEEELEATAFHEAGHALVAYHTPGTLPIYKATITQRGQALGHVSQIPTLEDETGSSKAKMLAMIDVLMGGRVAEEILLGKDNVSTGASSDLQKATAIAYELICSMGMSDNLGFMRYSYQDASPETKFKIETEANRILKLSYARAKDLLAKHSHQHKLLAKGLVKYETLTLEEIKMLLSTQSIKSVEKYRNQLPSLARKHDVAATTDSIPNPV